MSTSLHLTKKEARRIALIAQGFHAKKINTTEAIVQMGYVQIDTISVTERAHNHVLYTRNPKFKPEELGQLMEEKAIFEYWSHAAAYLPIKDYVFSLYQKNIYKTGGKHWFPRDRKTEKYVLDRIRAEGPLQSKDFESKEKSDHPWGNRKPTKMAMTNLFMEGTIMIDHRKGFQKVFDLTEHVLPDHMDLNVPTKEEYAHHLVNNAIQAHGIVNLQEIIYLRKGIKATVSKLLEERVEAGELHTLSIEGLETVYYTDRTQMKNFDGNIKVPRRLHILNPFDNLLIQRKRMTELFDFEYLLECYVPEKKRIHGYYTLSLLYGTAFVGRFDAKADRKKGVFQVKKIWFEKGFSPTKRFGQLLDKELLAYANFCGCTIVQHQTS